MKNNKNKFRKFKNALKYWAKIIFVFGLAILINTFPIILSLVNDNWWLMLLYIIVPIIDVLYLIFLKALLEIFNW